MRKKIKEREKVLQKDVNKGNKVTQDSQLLDSTFGNVLKFLFTKVTPSSNPHVKRTLCVNYKS